MKEQTKTETRLKTWYRRLDWPTAPWRFVVALVLGGIAYVTLALMAEVLLTARDGRVHHYFDREYASETLDQFMWYYRISVYWTFGWSALVVSVYPLFCALYGVRLNEVWYRGLFAGAVALVPLGLAVLLLGLTIGGPVITFTHFLLGPGIATPVLQLAGALSVKGDCARTGPLRFGLRHLLIAAGGVALALTFVRVMDWMTYDVIVWLAVWSVYQVATFGIVLWVCRWRERRRIEARGGNDD